MNDSKNLDFFASGDLFLLVSDGMWCLVCDSESPQLNSLLNPPSAYSESSLLTMASLDMLTTYYSLHPRMDTILEFHKRSIDFQSLVRNKSWNGVIHHHPSERVRLTTDPLLIRWIEHTRRPAILIPIAPAHSMAEVELKNHEFAKRANHLLHSTCKDLPNQVPMVSMDANGELLFHRQ
ncbi:MAG: hypothetical protein IPM48_09810 [Saprospiraceae bacterium]|nr:hypothetical protein [Saprospiraceae bacterium]